jgi:hypothetical protein
MRKSVGLLAAAALCLGAASGARAQGIQFTPFTSNGTTPQFTPFSSGGTQITQPFLSGFGTPARPATNGLTPYPAPGRTLTGPSRLMSLFPNLGRFSNTHYVGFSVVPSQTNQYLAQFGYQRLH